MKKQSKIKEYIEEVFHNSRFAVLATEGDGQPHTSLIAITPVNGFRHLVFATYRNTLKYRNLVNNSKVAVLIEGEHVKKGIKQKVVMTIIGHSQECSITEYEMIFQAHLMRHPHLESFMRSPDCSLMLVIASSYQVVFGIDDIRWISSEDIDLD
jgi:heme iron utilization protein